jgi:hypothetical protein
MAPNVSMDVGNYRPICMVPLPTRYDFTIKMKFLCNVLARSLTYIYRHLEVMLWGSTQEVLPQRRHTPYDSNLQGEYHENVTSDSNNRHWESPREVLCWRMASSGMLRRVALVRTDVSEELSLSFIRVTRIGEIGTTLAVTSNRRNLRRNTKWGFFAACVGW